ncbi:protein of unknown function [Candidatus Hydrogenisulfobacillus filiaventi]|uniref:Uncharacterized protein n=1 Tax=Candidatus Hydrogenisulfobacillus filiaventi TaxID=2707344 RepID=A0A6F8ZI86_9FIRM|nr:protein of unknown function [Candidatus Hydrogenisulfobacillus filiaventi]
MEPTLCGWLGRLAMPMALYGPEAHRTREPEPGARRTVGSRMANLMRKD